MKCALCVIESGADITLIPDAVTQINGTRVCVEHAVALSDTPAFQRDIMNRQYQAQRPESQTPPRPPRQ